MLMKTSRVRWRAQSVPMDRELWKPENYLDFLAARRHLLARAMNEFVASWIPDDVGGTDEQGVRRMMASGENTTVEFKSSLRWDRRQEYVNKDSRKNCHHDAGRIPQRRRGRHAPGGC